MSWMFGGRPSFNQPLSDWRVDSVTDMRGMFRDASSFNQPLNDWRVDKVERMADIRRRLVVQPTAERLAGDNVTIWPGCSVMPASFNHPLNDWRVDNVTDVSWMFPTPRRSTNRWATGGSTRPQTRKACSQELRSRLPQLGTHERACALGRVDRRCAGAAAHLDVEHRQVTDMSWLFRQIRI